MVKIDLKDRKILYELDLNCRQSNTQIGKTVGLKKDVVSYRIKRLQEQGIIKNFWTEINTFKFGYFGLRLTLLSLVIMFIEFISISRMLAPM